MSSWTCVEREEGSEGQNDLGGQNPDDVGEVVEDLRDEDDCSTSSH